MVPPMLIFIAVMGSTIATVLMYAGLTGGLIVSMRVPHWPWLNVFAWTASCYWGFSASAAAIATCSTQLKIVQVRDYLGILAAVSVAYCGYAVASGIDDDNQAKVVRLVFPPYLVSVPPALLLAARFLVRPARWLGHERHGFPVVVDAFIHERDTLIAAKNCVVSDASTSGSEHAELRSDLAERMATFRGNHSHQLAVWCITCSCVAPVVGVFLWILRALGVFSINWEVARQCLQLALVAVIPATGLLVASELMDTAGRRRIAVMLRGFVLLMVGAWAYRFVW